MYNLDLAKNGARPQNVSCKWRTFRRTEGIRNMKRHSRHIILLSLALVITVQSCKTDIPNDKQTDSPKHYSSFNDFEKYITPDPLDFSSIQLTNLLTKKSGKDTSIDFFTFQDQKLGIASILSLESSDNPCDNRYTYHSIINNKIVYESNIPDSLRGWGLGKKEYCNFNLELNKARKFQLNGLDYLIIPSSTSECIGGFCHNKIDHI